MSIDARVSAAYDDAARCAQLQATLEADGWTVIRRATDVPRGYTVTIEADPGIPGLVESETFPRPPKPPAPTMLDAMRDAVSWALNEEVSG